MNYTISYTELYYRHESHSWWGVLDTTLCDKVCQWFAASCWFSLGTLIDSTNKTDLHDTTEILLKVALNTTTQYLIWGYCSLHSLITYYALWISQLIWILHKNIPIKIGFNQNGNEYNIIRRLFCSHCVMVSMTNHFNCLL